MNTCLLLPIHPQLWANEAQRIHASSDPSSANLVCHPPLNALPHELLTYVPPHHCHHWVLAGVQRLSLNKPTDQRASLFPTVSGSPPEVPCVTRSGQVYEHRLILKYIEENGKDPITGEELKVEDLVVLKLSTSHPPSPAFALFADM